MRVGVDQPKCILKLNLGKELCQADVHWIVGWCAYKAVVIGGRCVIEVAKDNAAQTLLFRQLYLVTDTSSKVARCR
jgi:hypothetical protein